jgi:tetratricopeptide (TPR) repeat protein
LEKVLNPPEIPKVLYFYGIGSIGKSWLLMKLEREAQEQKVLTAMVDLERIGDPEDFYEKLWDSLPEKARESFKSTKKIVEKLEEFREKRQEVKKGTGKEIAAGAYQVAKAAAAAAGDTFIAPGVGSGSVAALEAGTKITYRMIKSGDPIIDKLNEEMAKALASDLDRCRKKNQKIVFFLDTFERCSPLVGCSALAVIENLHTKAVIAVAGRESLVEHHLPRGEGWEEIIEENELGELDYIEIKDKLQSEGVQPGEADTRARKIADISRGFPLLVRFILETLEERGYGLLDDLAEVGAVICEERQKFLKERILEVMDKLDADSAHSLRAAAFPRWFNEELFTRLLRIREEGIVGRAVTERLEKLEKFSFAQRVEFGRGREKEVWLRLHPVIQEAVRDYWFAQSKETWRAMNKASHEYFAGKESSKSPLEEIFHDYQSRPMESFKKFVGTYQKMAKDSEKWRLADILLEDFSSYCAEVPLKAEAEDIFTIFQGVDSLLFEYPRGDRSALCLRRIKLLRSAEGIAVSSEHKASIQNSLGNAWAQLPTGDRAENIETAIGHYNNALKVYTREGFPADWAMTHNNLGNAYSERIKGDRAENIETAIEYYINALKVYTREAFPERWAMIHNNLGAAYADRIKGDRADNIETAIGHYKDALEVRTREALPADWAMIHNNLGEAYRARIKGDRADNIETAIRHFKDALEVYTREALPADWATTHNNLGNAYSERIKGDRAENIETAIEYYINALKVYTREAFPERWAMIHNNLGNAYRNSIKGDRAENIEKAIGHYNNSLEVWTREAFPADWALTHNNLGIAYRNRIKGDRAENIETAIGHYKDALEVRTREALPADWAMTHNNLGEAYKNRIKGDRAENIETAIGHYNNALEVRTREALPADWATTHNNLGNAYRNRIKGDRAENIETAIGHYKDAFEVYTREAFPEQWAMTHHNLGAAYYDRIKGDRDENIESAIMHYNNALEVTTREALPAYWATTHNNLGGAYLNRIKGDRAENIETAIEHYINALEVRTREALPINFGVTKFNLALVYLDSDYPMPEKERLQIALGHLEEACEVLIPEYPTHRPAFDLRDWVKKRLGEIG